jgi:hypothetical protein
MATKPPSSEFKSFFDRWSQRKSAAARGDDYEHDSSAGAEVAPSPQAEPEDRESGPADPIDPDNDAAERNAPEQSSDFSRYVREGISDAVQATALRRLWLASPLFGTSDGLDIYCGDYSCAPQPDGTAEAEVLRRAIGDTFRRPSEAETPTPAPTAAITSSRLASNDLNSGNNSTVARFRSYRKPEESGRD